MFSSGQKVYFFNLLINLQVSPATKHNKSGQRLRTKPPHDVNINKHDQDQTRKKENIMYHIFTTFHDSHPPASHIFQS